MPKPSCHDIMVGKWIPSKEIQLKGRLPGFGVTVNVINGGIRNVETVLHYQKLLIAIAIINIFVIIFKLIQEKTLNVIINDLLDNNSVFQKLIPFSSYPHSRIFLQVSGKITWKRFLPSLIISNAVLGGINPRFSPNMVISLNCLVLSSDRSICMDL